MCIRDRFTTNSKNQEGSNFSKFVYNHKQCWCSSQLYEGSTRIRLSIIVYSTVFWSVLSFSSPVTSSYDKKVMQSTIPSIDTIVSRWQLFTCTYGNKFFFSSSLSHLPLFLSLSPKEYWAFVCLLVVQLPNDCLTLWTLSRRDAHRASLTSIGVISVPLLFRLLSLLFVL